MSGTKPLSQAQGRQRKISDESRVLGMAVGRRSAPGRELEGHFQPWDELFFRRIYLGFTQILHHMDSTILLTTPCG